MPHPYLPATPVPPLQQQMPGIPMPLSLHMPFAAHMLAGSAGVIHGTPSGQLGALYSNETSTFGPSRHALGQGGADSQVVYSNAASLSTGEMVSSRGSHPYGS